MSRPKVAAVVVTYNRPEELIVCLDGIMAQERLPEVLFIVDNHSEMSTPEQLFEAGFISRLPEKEAKEDRSSSRTLHGTKKTESEIEVVYIRKHKNDGGAGGFYTGMKQACDRGVDWVWMMDDDGVPDSKQLSLLMDYAETNDYHFLNALVISKDDESQLAFELGNLTMKEITASPFLPDHTAAFNGTLLSRKLIDEIGLIKKEMFIWGDETEYTHRTVKHGFKKGTVTSALHRHPPLKGKKVNVLPFSKRYKIILKPEHFSHHYYRNLGYNTAQYGTQKAMRVLYIFYTVYFLRKWKWKELMKFYTWFSKGIQNDYR